MKGCGCGSHAKAVTHAVYLIDRKEWRARNSEKVKAQKKAYYARHRETLKAKQRAYYAKNVHARRAYDRRYYVLHKDRIMEAARRWAIKNPAKHAVSRKKIKKKERDTISDVYIAGVLRVSVYGLPRVLIEAKRAQIMCHRLANHKE